jgi:hypothetical protein
MNRCIMLLNFDQERKVLIVDKIRKTTPDYFTLAVTGLARPV